MAVNRWKRTSVIGALTAGILVALALPVLADERDISVGGVWICRITHDASGYTSYQRAVEVNRRITQVLSAPELRTGAQVTVRPMSSSAVIMVGDLLVFTVAPEDAMDTPVTPFELARQWAQRLAEGLTKGLPGYTSYF